MIFRVIDRLFYVFSAKIYSLANIYRFVIILGLMDITKF